MVTRREARGGSRASIRRARWSSPTPSPMRTGRRSRTCRATRSRSGSRSGMAGRGWKSSRGSSPGRTWRSSWTWACSRACSSPSARWTASSRAGLRLVRIAAVPVEDRRRWLSLYVLCVGMLMIVLDATIVNVALPTIQDDLGFSQNDLAWVVNAYLIAFGGLLLLAGRIGDLIGQRRIFQGVGGALTSAVILGMIVTMFPEPREQAKAIGVYTFVAVAGGSIGLL